MIPTVHLLATVRKPELLPAALLVFKTIRTGFPSARVCVWGNDLNEAAASAVDAAARSVGGAFVNLPHTSHDCWIDGLLARAGDPFWICDTDVVFWSEVEKWFEGDDELLFAGRYEPAFDEEWTSSVHVARLHTCLMHINPVNLRSQLRAWMARVPPPWRHSAQFALLHQHFVPVMDYFNGPTRVLFYDTCAGFHHAFVGTPFTEPQNAAFEHLLCATYADLVDAPSLSGMKTVHAQVYADTAAARGLRESQEKYYARRAITGKGLCPINRD